MNENEQQIITSVTRQREAPSTAWKPGQSGNPNGRPRKTWKAMLERLLDSKEIKMEVVLLDDSIRTYQIKVSDKTIKEAVCVAMINSALKGDIQSIREILDRTDGKVPVRISPEDDGPAQIMIVENVITEAPPKELQANQEQDINGISDNPDQPA